MNSTVAPSVRSPIYRLAPWLSPTPLASLFSLLVLVWISGCNGSLSLPKTSSGQWQPLQGPCNNVTFPVAGETTIDQPQESANSS